MKPIRFADIPLGKRFYQTETATEADVKVESKGRYNARGTKDRIHSYFEPNRIVYIEE